MIRHALTAQSRKRFISDDSKDLSISKEGKEQVLSLRSILRKKVRVDMIFTALSKRSIQTAMIVFPYSKKKTIRIEEFNEIDKGFGIFLMNNPSKRKMTVDEWEKTYNNSKSFIKRNEFKYPSGRAIKEMRKTVIKKFLEIIENNKTKNINLVIISHNGPIKAIISFISGDRADSYFKINIPYCSYAEIDYNRDKFRLVRI